MVVVVAGSSGLIGTALVERLRAEGHTVRRLVRRAPRGTDEVRWDPDAGVLPPEALAGADAVVNLAGAGVGDKRLTDARKRVVIESRTRSTGLIASAIADMDRPPRVLLQGSATGAYGERGEDLVTEAEPYGETFLSGVVRAWEAAAAPAVARPGVRVAFLRSGIVLAPRGGALGKLLPLIRLGVGGPLGTGRQYWSWISLEDEVRAILHLLDAPVSGPVNLVAQPARHGDIVRAIAAELHRPALVRVPGWALKIAIGQFSEEILGSLRATPTALAAAGFVHLHPTPEAAAAAMLR
ncbi:TIGR01777 family oxidoreductase [Cellulomonas hominis]|uniref:TIGR01777 family oxidoreductase n=1 Tax=Cellulomonas hominis TaxID=156981 RepID=UPI001B92C73D|nr:TIGR01777 family oxidoreductase [Cellulomonas hominis]VTR78022.1 Epimerase family protein [Cellulomonas hominis]